MRVTPTLNFSGSCREAMALYQKAFGGRVAFQLTYREADDPAYLPRLTEEQKDCIYHADFLLGDQPVHMCDNFDVDPGVGRACFLTIAYDTAEEVLAAYAALMPGGTVIYPPEATGYSPCRTVLVDRFGIRWGIMVE